MNVETITMDPKLAAAKLEAAKKILRRQKRNPEVLALADAYRALEKGTPLIDPIKAIRQAGWDEKGLPKLAMSRADRERVEFHLRNGGRWVGERWAFDPSSCRAYFRAAVGARRYPGLDFEVDTMPQYPLERPNYGTKQAIVPLIPPDVYPERGHGQRKDWYILWEAEWQNMAPKDPILMKPIGGNLYAVLAAWDLTEVERAVLEGLRITG